MVTSCFNRLFRRLIIGRSFFSSIALLVVFLASLTTDFLGSCWACACGRQDLGKVAAAAFLYGLEDEAGY